MTKFLLSVLFVNNPLPNSLWADLPTRAWAVLGLLAFLVLGALILTLRVSFSLIRNTRELRKLRCERIG